MIVFKPIGTVHNEMTQAHRDTLWPKIESTILLDNEWSEALDGLEEFSHIWVIFYLDRMPALDSLQARPMSRDDMPIVGRLASRSPMRPNPIGMTAVELLERRGCLLRVRGLDALDGTPVLDIKPYLARGDAIAGTRVGEWVTRYWDSLDKDSA